MPFFTECQPKLKHRLQGDKKTLTSDGRKAGLLALLWGVLGLQAVICSIVAPDLPLFLIENAADAEAGETDDIKGNIHRNKKYRCRGNCVYGTPRKVFVNTCQHQLG